MGRKKITIRPIKDERSRGVTFIKRKYGLYKKAHQLAVLTGCDAAVSIIDRKGRVYIYSSTSYPDLVQRSQAQKPVEFKTPQDFAFDDDGADHDSEEYSTTTAAASAAAAAAAAAVGSSAAGEGGTAPGNPRTHDVARDGHDFALAPGPPGSSGPKGQHAKKGSWHSTSADSYAASPNLSDSPNLHASGAFPPNNGRGSTHSRHQSILSLDAQAQSPFDGSGSMAVAPGRAAAQHESADGDADIDEDEDDDEDVRMFDKASGQKMSASSRAGSERPVGGGGHSGEVHAVPLDCGPQDPYYAHIDQSSYSAYRGNDEMDEDDYNTNLSPILDVPPQNDRLESFPALVNVLTRGGDKWDGSGGAGGAPPAGEPQPMANREEARTYYAPPPTHAPAQGAMRAPNQASSHMIYPRDDVFTGLDPSQLQRPATAPFHLRGAIRGDQAISRTEQQAQHDVRRSMDEEQDDEDGYAGDSPPQVSSRMLRESAATIKAAFMGRGSTTGRPSAESGDGPVLRPASAKLPGQRQGEAMYLAGKSQPPEAHAQRWSRSDQQNATLPVLNTQNLEPARQVPQIVPATGSGGVLRGGTWDPIGSAGGVNLESPTTWMKTDSGLFF